MFGGFKTVAYGVCIGLIGALSTPEMQVFIGAHIPSLSAAIGTGIVVLRAMTSSAIFNKVA